MIDSKNDCVKDRAIILRNKFLAGDDKAFAELYNLFAKELYAYGLFICNNKRITEDALHDVFMAVFSNRKLLANVENVKFYFNSAYRYRVLYLLKKEGKQCELEYSLIENLPDTKNFQDDLIQEEEVEARNALVKKIFKSLNEHQREVLYKRFVEGLSLQEIASIMNINYQSVKNIIQRSLTKIKNSEVVAFIIISTVLIKLIAF
ncbi:MAG: RNA polymerase sigma factor [Paludibacter sp.]|jgi:RNA polymerase sigma factor (sigma-70 family)|nr:RNA polymerase sigma factor [Paludibacter sp.]